MAVQFSNAEKEFSFKDFTIQLKTTPDSLILFFIESNLTMKEIWVRRKKNRQPCCELRDIVVTTDRGVSRKDFDEYVCPDPCPPDPCPPDPCHSLDYLKEHEDHKQQGDYRREQGIYLKEHDEYTTKQEILESNQEQDPDYDRGTESAGTQGSISAGRMVKVENMKYYGFSRLGGINRSKFHTLMYRCEILQAELEEGFNLVQVFSKNGTGEMALLLSQGIEIVNAGAKNESLSQANSEGPFDYRTDTKVDRSEFELLRNDFEALKEEFNQSTGNIKTQPENPQKQNPRGKAQL